MASGDHRGVAAGARRLPRSEESSKMESLPYTGHGDRDWHKFDPEAYCARNYRALRDDDRQVVEKLGAFFASCAIPKSAHGVDVGAGSNLYPAFGMLPFCKKVDLLESSSSNVRWLERNRRTLWIRRDRRWDPFWETYLKHSAYKRAGSRTPYRSLFRKVRVRRASVFDLPSHAYDVGTMFFVACSLSTRIDDFYSAVDGFGRCLKSGAPFAMAFMTNSDGYPAGDRWFPAVRVGVAEIAPAIKAIAPEASFYEIEPVDPLRSGVGMMLVTGTKFDACG